MAKFLSVFSVGNLLVLSLALNVSLFLRVLVLHDSKNGSFLGLLTGKQNGQQEDRVNGVASSVPHPSSSLTIAQHDEDRVINLDQ